MKKTRILKVHSSTYEIKGAGPWAIGSLYNEVPAILLKGKWLRDVCGIDVADKITVECDQGRIVITKKKEI